jgi:hypothetical protein
VHLVGILHHEVEQFIFFLVEFILAFFLKALTKLPYTPQRRFEIVGGSGGKLLQLVLRFGQLTGQGDFFKSIVKRQMQGVKPALAR